MVPNGLSCPSSGTFYSYTPITDIDKTSHMTTVHDENSMRNEPFENTWVDTNPQAQDAQGAQAMKL